MINWIKNKLPYKNYKVELLIKYENQTASSTTVNVRGRWKGEARSTALKAFEMTTGKVNLVK